jgi:hypothetical protein
MVGLLIEMHASVPRYVELIVTARFVLFLIVR